MHGDASPVGAHVGDEIVEQRPSDAGGCGRPLDREPGDRIAQRGELRDVAVIAELLLVGPAFE